MTYLHIFLFSQPLGPADYLEISKAFDTIIITEIPQLDLKRKMETRRFITAIDNLYDNHVSSLIALRIPMLVLIRL